MTNSPRPLAPKTWCVLSGGGAALFWEAGVVVGLHHAGITFDRYAGTSAGAIVAGLAAGGRLDFLKKKLPELSGKAMWGPQYPWRVAMQLLRAYRMRGFVDPRKLRDLIAEALPDDVIRDMPPGSLCVTVTDLGRGGIPLDITEAAEPETVRAAILASASIPFIFPPVLFRYRRKLIQGVDGGVSDNAPLETAAHYAKAYEGELWLISATESPKIGLARSAGEALATLMNAHLAQELRLSKDAAERLGFVRGKDLHIVQAPATLGIDLVDFTTQQAQHAYTQGVRAGFDAGRARVADQSS